MCHEDQLPEELIELEHSLATFEPVPGRIDRDRLMFDAGAASEAARTTAASGSWLGHFDGGRGWRLSACAAALIACLFASLYVAERSRPPVVLREVVMIERPESAAPEAFEATLQNPSTDRESPSTEYRVPSTPHYAFHTPHSALLLTFWPFTSFQPPATSHPPPITSHQPPATYFALRQFVLARGVDALPHREDASSGGFSSEPLRQPSTIRELMKEFMPSSAKVISTETENTWLTEPTT